MRGTSPAAKAVRLVRTVRHLKLVQLYARAALKLSRARPDPRPAPPLRGLSGFAWTAPVTRPASIVAEWRVKFLNVEGVITTPENWNDSSKAKLWLYNLHYFDDLCAADGTSRREIQRALINRWIAENPPAAGNGWEPYPVSLRIVNWIKWHQGGESLDDGMRDSLAMQTRWLMDHIEWHLLGNHILANAKALVFAGLFFSGPEADRWLAQGLSLYDRELPEQILPDGAHFELSPMYHAIILEDVLDLINVARCYDCLERGPLQTLGEIAQRMRWWLAAMTHPDGGPSFFNDAAFGIAASRMELEAYAARLGLPPVHELGDGVHHLSASGYVRINRGEMAAILDVASPGPDYIPGHAHADTLSFELSIGDERVIVNGGTSTYAPGPEREAQRSTAAHSTVEIDGENSSEVWASFRVARRARVTALAIDAQDGVIQVTAAHDGYRRLSGRNTHSRTWQFAANQLQVRDNITGPVRNAVARFLIAPRIRVENSELEATPARGQLSMESGRTCLWKSDGHVALAPAKWHPEFGVMLATQCITVTIAQGMTCTSFEW